MSVRIQAVCIDARDPSTLARFWSHVLGWRVTHEEPGEVVLEPPAGSPEDGVAADMLFLAVPEGKAAKQFSTRSSVTHSWTPRRPTQGDPAAISRNTPALV